MCFRYCDCTNVKAIHITVRLSLIENRRHNKVTANTKVGQIFILNLSFIIEAINIDSRTHNL